jgi:predicted aspartyl protease
MKLVVPIIVAALTACATASAGAQSALPSRGGTTPFDGPARTELASAQVDVPLTKIGDFYFVDVRLNGQPLRFTLETGAGFAVITRRAADALGLRQDTVEIMPGGRGPVVRIDSLSFGGVTLRGVVARVTSSFDGREFDGLLSIPLLRDVLATLDLANSRLVLEHGALPAPDGRTILPIAGRDRGGRVDVVTRIGAVDVPLVLDTRAAQWIIVSDSIGSALPLNAPPREVAQAWGPSLGAFTLRGARLNDDIRLGEHVVRQPALLFRERAGGLIGLPFLEQYRVTIDQRNQRVRFVRSAPGAVVTIPIQSWEAGPTARRTLGFGIGLRPGGALTVANVLAGSSAERLGIKAGDQIVEIDGTPAEAMNPAVVRAAVNRGGPVKVIVLRETRRVEFNVEPYVMP